MPLGILALLIRHHHRKPRRDDLVFWPNHDAPNILKNWLDKSPSKDPNPWKRLETAKNLASAKDVGMKSHRLLIILVENHPVVFLSDDLLKMRVHKSPGKNALENTPNHRRFFQIAREKNN